MGFFDTLGSAVQAVGSGGLSLAAPGISGDPNIIADAVTGGAVSNAQAVAQTNAQNIAYAQQQENYQTLMSNTSYQRAVQDMKAAGLNPMLAYSQGGASVPTGVSPDLQAPRPGDIGGGLLNTAKAIAGQSVDMANTQSQTSLNQHNSELASAKVDQTTANASESYQNIEQSKQSVKESAQRTKESQARTAKAQEEAKQAGMNTKVQEAGFDSEKFLAPINSWFNSLKGALGLASSAKDLAVSKAVGMGSGDSESKALRRSGSSGLPTSGYENVRVRRK